MWNKPLEKDTSYLYTIRQKPNKPLREYLAHINKAMLEILKLELRLALQVAKRDMLFKSAFFNSISKCKLTS